VKLSRKLCVALALLWTFFVLYPNPWTLVRSIDHVRHPRVDAAAAREVAATMPDDPRLIEAEVQQRVVPYSYDWQSSGVPWYFATTREALRSGRGDCESRAVVLASILDAKGIPYELRMSFDHIWVEYPGKQPNAIENDDVVLADRRGWRWPREFHPVDFVRTQVSGYWTPMPVVRKGLLVGGLAVIALLRPVLRIGRRRMGASDTMDAGLPA